MGGGVRCFGQHVEVPPGGAACGFALIMLLVGALMTPLGMVNLATASSLDAEVDFTFVEQCTITSRTSDEVTTGKKKSSSGSSSSSSSTSSSKPKRSYECHDVYKYGVRVPGDSKTYFEKEKLKRCSCKCSTSVSSPREATFAAEETVVCWTPTRDVSEYMDSYGCATGSCLRLWDPAVAVDDNVFKWFRPNPKPQTPNPKPQTLYPTPCTLYPAPCTLHANPQT